jgi:DNA modification methylase/predicted RNA-binding Zn-ribbon protein involved in translation (DUF1610 family)
MRDDLNELRDIEGFPIGEDKDLHALSDPPYYTAYPNPHIEELIEKWGTAYDEATDDYHREPYVADVSEGKGGTIYNAHTYHTKVPQKAIVPFIKHYTQPDDIVLDTFCGSGMTGVAAQFTGRYAILADLSPVATFIAYNLNASIDKTEFRLEAARILNELEEECGWMYKTWHPTCDSPSRIKVDIDYTVWSDVFCCPYCGEEIVYYRAASNRKQRTSSSRFPCPSCDAQVSTRSADRAFETVSDEVLGQEIRRVKRVPVQIHYSVGSTHHIKEPDSADLEIVNKIESQVIPYWYPTDRMPPGDEARRNDSQGMTHVHHFYTKRSLWTYSALWHHIRNADIPHRIRARLMFWAQSAAIGQTHMNRYFEASYSQVNRYLKGTLYVGPKKSEVSPRYGFTGKMKQIARAAIPDRKASNLLISTMSATADHLPKNSIDYIFTDPPFGANIMYSELNFIWECWLRVKTNNTTEAIINDTQDKHLADYYELMREGFLQMYEALKPGRWITVVFHNSRASVWNAIQEALSQAGFVVAQVVTMDKKQKTMQQMTSPGSVKNDLVINAYKPRDGFTQQLLSGAGRDMEADFVAQHLAQLPVAANIERTQEMLYSKYLAYYVQRGYQVAYNSEQFYRALPQWGFVEIDGYWFANETQANEYEKRKAKLAAPKGKHALQQQQLFISNEKSARRWIWNFLETPQTYDAIYTAFVQALQTSEDDIPELQEMLDEGFVRTNGRWKRPDALTREELEQRRRARLLRQFDEYLKAAKRGQRLKEVRKEAVLEGFTEAYRGGRFNDIMTMGRKLPSRLVEESPDLRDFIEIAEARMEG